jgi:hypothetical protein
LKDHSQSKASENAAQQKDAATDSSEQEGAVAREDEDHCGRRQIGRSDHKESPPPEGQWVSLRVLPTVRNDKNERQHTAGGTPKQAKAGGGETNRPILATKPMDGEGDSNQRRGRRDGD